MNLTYSKRGLRAVCVPCILILAACGGTTLYAGGGNEAGADGPDRKASGHPMEDTDGGGGSGGDSDGESNDGDLFDAGFFTTCGDAGVQCAPYSYCQATLGGAGSGGTYYACFPTPKACHGVLTCECAGYQCNTDTFPGAYRCDGVNDDNYTLTCVANEGGADAGEETD
jgi:hypothetical protein